MKARISILLLGLMASAPLIANCGGDDTGDSTPANGGSAGKGGGGGSSAKGGSAGSTAGSAGSQIGTGGTAGSIGSGGSAGSGGNAGSAGSAGSGGAPVSDAGEAGPPVDGGADAAKDAAADATSSTDGASTDAATGSDVVDAGSADASSASDASDGGSSTSDGASDAAASSDASDASSITVVINEVNSMGTDFAEFYNTTANPVDISGWYATDSDPTHIYTFPASTILAGHAFLQVTALGFGLGDTDAVVLHQTGGQIVDQYTWSVNGGITRSRCPDGTGAFVDKTATPGAANSCL